MEEREALILVGPPVMDTSSDRIKHIDVQLIAQQARARIKLNNEKGKAPRRRITLHEAAAEHEMPQHELLLMYLEHHLDLVDDALVWIIDGVGRSLGQSAGVIINGERLIDILGVRYPAAQLIWLWRTGDWSGKVIHVDGDKLNNSIGNLHSDNSGTLHQQYRERSDSAQGHRGVRFDVSRNKFSASIDVDGKNIRLGRFDNIEAAITARADADIKYNFRAEYKKKRVLAGVS